MKPTRRQCLVFAAAGLPLLSVAQETALPRPASLIDEARAASKRGDPLVLLVSLPGCPYCERIRRSHLSPLLRDSGGGVVQIDLGSSDSVVDFDGAPRTHAALAKAWNASFAPTVLFLGPRGAELAERLVGAGIPDYYGAYLDQRLATAREALTHAP